jgi:hypothetical protein
MRAVSSVGLLGVHGYSIASSNVGLLELNNPPGSVRVRSPIRPCANISFWWRRYETSATIVCDRLLHLLACFAGGTRQLSDLKIQDTGSSIRSRDTSRADKGRTATDVNWRPHTSSDCVEQSCHQESALQVLRGRSETIGPNPTGRLDCALDTGPA